MKKKKAKVFARELDKQVSVLIGNLNKPKIKKSILSKWQSLLDALTQDFELYSGLIMKLNKKNIEVFSKSQNKENPYKLGAKEDVGCGLYCENVIGTQKKLIVKDALQDKLWRENNPDIPLGMISYLGYPVNWPDGEVFGTICLLHNSATEYDSRAIKILLQTKQLIETDLSFLMTSKKIKAIKKRIKEILKEKSKLLLPTNPQEEIVKLDDELKLLMSTLNKYIVAIYKK